MNIVEAYIKYKGQLVIFISGISGCGKTFLAKKLSKNFKIQFLEQFSYYKKNYDKKHKLPDGTEITNWYTDDAIDWDSFNKDINKMKNMGVVVSGFALVEDKLDIEPDYHIHLSMSKQRCTEKRKVFLEKHQKKYQKEFDELGTIKEKLRMNQLIFPYYLDATKRSKINKFFKVEKMSNEEIWDAGWDLIINHIQTNVSRHYKEWTDKQSSNAIKSEMNTDDLVGTNNTNTNTTSNQKSDIGETTEKLIALMEQDTELESNQSDSIKSDDLITTSELENSEELINDELSEKTEETEETEKTEETEETEETDEFYEKGEGPVEFIDMD